MFNLVNSVQLHSYPGLRPRNFLETCLSRITDKSHIFEIFSSNTLIKLINIFLTENIVT